MSEPVAGDLRPARNRGANVKSAVLHYVHVDPHDAGDDTARRAALCGATARYGWVFDPSWPSATCATCDRRLPRPEEKPDV